MTKHSLIQSRQSHHGEAAIFSFLNIDSQLSVEQKTPSKDPSLTYSVAVAQDNSLTVIRKLHYLRSALNAEPAKLLGNLPTTNANYTATKPKRGKRKIICQRHLRTLFQFAPNKRESAEQLTKVLNCFTEC